MDYLVKRDEYADAGIPHYWVIDLGEPGDRPQLTAHHLAAGFGYADPGAVTGTFTATDRFPSAWTSTRWSDVSDRKAA